MGGGLLQLASKGAQDVYLTGDPSITFFKAVYRKHTNFARENVPIFFDKEFSNGNKCIATISRNADLIGNMTLHFKTTEIKTNGNNSGANIITDRKWSTYIDYVDLLIGGNLIDRQHGEFLDAWHDLTTPDEKMGGKIHDPRRIPGATFLEKKRPGTLEMMGNALGTHNTGTTVGTSTYTFAMPLNFWFNKDTGSALPLIALQYHQVTVEVNFKPLITATSTTTGGNTLGVGFTSDEKLMVDYYYLDTKERTIYSKSVHEYLIEQVQSETNTVIKHTGANDTNSVVFTFNNPIKEIMWLCYDNNNDPVTRIDTANISLNGTDLTNPHPSINFTHIEPLKFHTRIPPGGNVYLHSFALRPEEHQPSGTCNFSRIEKANLVVKSGDVGIHDINIYATSYNILKIQSGMAALAFS
tara:strand:+ start:245 stop:1480 length:1236 start_codon:yes stop_codon:yes gene_type:complete